MCDETRKKNFVMLISSIKKPPPPPPNISALPLFTLYNLCLYCTLAVICVLAYVTFLKQPSMYDVLSVVQVTSKFSSIFMPSKRCFPLQT